MKKIIPVVAAALTAMLIFAACTKVKDLPFYADGTAVTLSSSATSIAPAPADSSNDVISFAWTNPEYASDSSTYKYVLEIDSAGRNFSNKVDKIVTGTLSTSLTGKELNTILLNYGFALGAPYDLDVRVVSSYGNNNEQLVSNIITVSVAAYGDASVFASSATSAECDINTASLYALDFSWGQSFSGYTGAVTYTLQSDSATKNFAAPAEIVIGTSVYTKAMTQGEINETALDAGIPGGNTGDVEYRVKATAASGATVYSNAVTVSVKTYFPLLRFYMPGGYQGGTGNGNNWDPGTAPEFIRDLRTDVFNDMYYMYIYLPGGSEFKITQGRSWDINYGGSGGTLVPGSPTNLSVSASGVYRISINRKTLQYDIREGRMGFVGGATGAGWNPPNVFPDYAMGAPAKNLFVGITDLAADGWKLIDNNEWNNGSYAVTETRSYGSAGGSGSTMEVNGANFPNPAAGKYRVIWDGRNVDDIKYEMSAATEMRVVGDGIDGVNEWDPGTSPQMTYLGNGIWTITVSLKASKSIKFLAGNAWGAFDYEDNGDAGTSGTTTKRKIKWEGGDNFATPSAAGNYTITLDEYNQTVTIVP